MTGSICSVPPVPSGTSRLAYPFRIQGITGGIPVPKPEGVLTGSIAAPRRVLTGTVGRLLTGSLRNIPTKKR